jgi:hypothetical protein
MLEPSGFQPAAANYCIFAGGLAYQGLHAKDHYEARADLESAVGQTQGEFFERVLARRRDRKRHRTARKEDSR